MTDTVGTAKQQSQNSKDGESNRETYTNSHPIKLSWHDKQIAVTGCFLTQSSNCIRGYSLG